VGANWIGTTSKAPLANSSAFAHHIQLVQLPEPSVDNLELMIRIIGNAERRAPIKE